MTLFALLFLNTASATECYDATWTPTTNPSWALDVASSLNSVRCDLTPPGEHWVPVVQSYGLPLTRDIWIRGSFDDPEYSSHPSGLRTLLHGPTFFDGKVYRDQNQGIDEVTTVVAPEVAPFAGGALVTLMNADDETCLVSSLGGAGVTALYDCLLSEDFMEDMQYELVPNGLDFTLKADFNKKCLFDDGSAEHIIIDEVCHNGGGDAFRLVPVASTNTHRIQHVPTGLCIDNDYSPVRLESCSQPGTEFHVVRTEDPNTSSTAALPGKM